MTTQQPEALRHEYRATMPIEVLHLWAKDALACITELESQLAQRFDAAAHGPTSGAADLPEALRVPLDSLHADAGYLCGRLLNGSLTQEQVVESIRRRIDAAKLAALTAQAISAEPAEHVQNPAENEHVAGDVSGNGAGLNMSTPHARITELESQLAQRFDAADMATAAAQGFRDGAASLTAQAADSVQEDAARVFTYKNQPCNNVTAWRFGEACRAAQPGGDPIDHGLSLLQKLQERGYGIVAIDSARKQGEKQ